MRHFDLAEYTHLVVEADVDLVWTPGPPRAKLRLRDNLLRLLKLEQSERTLRLSSPSDFEGDRPLIVLSGPQLLNIHTGSSACVDISDSDVNMLIASAVERSTLRIEGHAKEFHLECRQEGRADCASLRCDIAVAELSGDSLALLRADSALQAETRDSCHLMTIGTPRILDVAASLTYSKPQALRE